MYSNNQHRRTRARNITVRGWRDGEAVKKHSGKILVNFFFGPLFILWVFAVLFGVSYLAALILHAIH